MIERVKMVYSTEPEPNIIRYLNDGYKDFCFETEVLRRALGITLVADENVYPIPPDVVKITSIDLYESEDTVPRNVDLAVTDANDNYVLDTYGDLTYTAPTTTESYPISELNYVANWGVENDHIIINILTDGIEALPSGNPAVAVLNYIRVPEYLSDYDDEPLIDMMFHDAIVMKALERLSMKAPIQISTQNGVMTKIGDIQTASYYRGLYMEYVAKGKKMGTVNRDGSPYNIIPANY